MKNTKVSLVPFQKNECEVDGDKIVNISNYHSIEFKREGDTMELVLVISSYLVKIGLFNLD